MKLLTRNPFFAATIVLAGCMLWSAQTARGNINIELRPGANAAVPNAIVNIGLYLVSDSSVNQFASAADVVFGWDNTRLQFLGIDNTGGAPVLVSVLPPAVNLNEVVPPQDGDGYYQMLSQLGNPVAATPAGRLITTFRFRALSTSCTGAFFAILPSGGSPQINTRVLDGFTPGLPVTGTLGSSLVFIDGVSPVINTCAPAQTIPVNGSCQGLMPDLTGLITVTDNCPANLTITQTPLAGTMLALGPHAVQMQVKDPGNNIAVCNTSVTVTDQTAPQIATCPGAQTIAANASCQAAIPDLTPAVVASDNCTATPSLVITQSPTAGTMVGLGEHTVTITVKDATGNESTCPVVVTVEDQTDPVIIDCAGAQTLAADADCEAAIPDLTGDVVANDNCTAAIDLVITQSPTAGTTVGLGEHVVTITVEDAAGNESTCPVVVTVEDQTDPEITTCPGAQTIAANATCQAAIPNLTAAVVATDNCTLAANLLIAQSPAAGTMVGLGDHNVTITVEDAAGNETTCPVVVTVEDQTPPVLVGCPTNIVTNTNAGNCAAVVSWTEPTATDNCTGSPTVTRTQGPAPGGSFAANSVTTIEYTATDGANLTTTCSFTVTVNPSPDMDNDGDVDVDDMPIFINVLLGTDTDPVRVTRADVNCDGFVDGRDVQPFVDILTP